MSVLSLDEAKELAFERVFTKVIQSDLHENSPTFFVIYAHDNDSLSFESHQKDVKKLISWFKRCFFPVVSDKSPQGNGQIYETVREGGNSNIITTQCSLLPRTLPNNVVYVLVFYTKLLAHYMKDEREFKFTDDSQPPQTYFDAIFQLCQRYKSDGHPKDLENEISLLQEKYSVAMRDKFHHVLTELALLRCRNSVHMPCYTIPIILGDDAEDANNWDADYQWKGRYLGMKESQIYLTVKPKNLHRSFFKILTQFEALGPDQRFIELLLECFDKSVAAHSPNMTDIELEMQIATNIVAAYGSLNKGRVYRRRRPVMVGTIRDILDVYARGCATLKRVSGEDLPSGLNDIEMEIPLDAEPIDQENEAANKYKKKPEPEKVPLRDLFNKRKDGDKDIQPYRIFVRGKPGVGKSTLCRRIMHAYSLLDELRPKFELVVLIPARKLNADLSDVLFEEYFRAADNGRELAQFLQDLILKDAEIDKPPKILVILDGLDEARGWEPRKRVLLDRLLRLPAVLVTSRTTDDAGSINVDLRVDAVGLSMDSVTAFLDNEDIVSSSTAQAIKHLISINSAVREIVRVPIYLDIICSGWGNGTNADHRKQPTMTALYEGVMHSLWRKDIPRLHKLDHGEPVTTETTQAVKVTSRLERVVTDEVLALEQIAITMMVENQLEFTDWYVSTTICRMELVHGPMPLSLEKNLAKLSVLRSSSAQYHFVHPTFQEFFAAKYIARHPDRIKAYMKSHKYHPRFDMIWRFVAGLLSDSHSPHLPLFFDVLGQEPLDLLGSTHQRMAMRCLYEIGSETKLFIREKLETSLLVWILYEFTVSWRSDMLAEAEIPMSILYTLLGGDSPKSPVSSQILSSLASSRAHFSAEVVSVLVEFLGDDKRGDAARALGSQANLPDEAVLRLVANLTYGHYVTVTAAEALSHQTSLSDEAVAAIIGLLEKKDERAEHVAEVIKHHPGFPDNVVAVANNVWLGDSGTQDPSDRLHELLEEIRSGHQPRYFEGRILRNLSDQAIQELLKHLGDFRFGEFARWILCIQRQLTDETILALMGLLNHGNSGVQYAAAAVLSERQYRSDWVASDQIVSGAIELLKHDALTAARTTGYSLLMAYSTNLSDTALESLAGLLKNDGDGAAEAAAVLGKRANLPDPVVQALLEVIKSGGSGRPRCAQVLRKQEHLSSSALSGLEGLLNDSALSVRATAVIALIRCRAKLEGSINSAIKDLVTTNFFKNDDSLFGLDFAESLRDYPGRLSNEAVTALESLLGTDAFQIQLMALETLQHYTVSDATIPTLISLLTPDKHYIVRIRSAKALGHQSLQGPHWTALAELLRQEIDISSLSSRNLGYSDELMDKLSRYIGLSLESESETVGEAPREEEPREEPPAPAVCEVETIDAWYGVWLCRSFRERVVLYVEDDTGPGKDRPPRLCLSQPSGLWTARFKDMRDYKRFLGVVERGRKRWEAPVVEKTVEKTVKKPEEKPEEKTVERPEKKKSIVIRWLGHH